MFSRSISDEESPNAFWTDYEDLIFFDETVEDREVHFMHADSCLIPRRHLLRAAQEEMPSPETVLVDDYWLSYVLRAKLNIPIWKIMASSILEVLPEAEDKHVALFFNPRVEEQRVNFYVYHMRRGWPYPTCPVKVASDRGFTGETRRHTWEAPLKGFNMFSEAPANDFQSAYDSGIRAGQALPVGLAISAI